MSEVKTYHVILNDANDRAALAADLKSVGATNVIPWGSLPRLLTFDIDVANPKHLEVFQGRVSYYRTAVQYELTNTRELKTNYNWALDRIDQRNPVLDRKSNITATGKGVNVYVLDSGVLMGHQELQGRVFADHAYDALRKDTSNPLYGQPSRTKHIDDHGTHVAALIAGNTVGVAVGAKIVPVRVFSEYPYAWDSVVYEGCNWILEDHKAKGGAAVVNMSFTTRLDTDPIVELIIATMIQQGLVVVVAAGNNSDDAYYYSPANSGSLRTDYLAEGGKKRFRLNTYESSKPITVGATSSPAVIAGELADSLSQTTNYGDVIDLFAPGHEVLSASVRVINDEPAYYWDQEYATHSGTSASAAIVTGIVALYLEQEPSLTHADVRRLLAERSTRGVIKSDKLVHRRKPEDYIRVGGSFAEFSDTQVQSPNRLAYVWYQETDLDWDGFKFTDDKLQKTVQENTHNVWKLVANSVNNRGDEQDIRYYLKPYKGVGVPVWVDFRSTSEGAVVEFIAPSVPDDLEPPYEFILVADNGRKTIEAIVSIKVLNAPQAPKWISPPAGDLTAYIFGDDAKDNNGEYHIKQGLSITAANREWATFRVVDPDLGTGEGITYELLPGPHALPPGLTLVGDHLEGIVDIIPRNIKSYRFLIRARKRGNLVAERTFAFGSPRISNVSQFWDQAWLDSLPAVSFQRVQEDGSTVTDIAYRLRRTNINSILNNELRVENPDGDVLTTLAGYIPGFIKEANQYEGLPHGLRIDDSVFVAGKITDVNPLGQYFFQVTISDPPDLEDHHVNRISANFFLDVRAEGDTGDDDGDNGRNNDVIWETPEGPIGSVYESQWSHLLVKARSVSGEPLTYAVKRGVMPQGMTLDPKTGYIVGRAPFVNANAQYEITVRASTAKGYVDGKFSFGIIDLYNRNGIFSVQAMMSGFQRAEVHSWSWLISIIPPESIFRHGDENFARVKYPHMYVVDGLIPPEATADHSMFDVFVEKLRDYHRKTDLMFGALKWAMAKDPSGKHVYDVLYFDLIDPVANAGGFGLELRGTDDNDPTNDRTVLVEQNVILPDTAAKLPVIRTWNLPKGTKQIFPNSITNMRNDLIVVDTNLDKLRTPRTASNIISQPPATDANTDFVDGGMGLAGAEGLPLWMTTEQVPGKPSSKLGFTPSVVLAYLKPGMGPAALLGLDLAGINKAIAGRIFTVDRYLVRGIGDVGVTTETTFDFKDLPGDVDEQLTFDNDTTTFDRAGAEVGKYYKFPPGDK